METTNFILEKKSLFGLERTVELLTKSAIQKGWSVPFIHDLQQSLAKSGKNVRPVKVIEICKPEYSGQMLELNDERIISVMMPCRISVYEKNDGLIYMAFINTGKLASGMPGNIEKVMKASFDEVLSMVDTIIKD
jgi:uncharacterized protein (DUF302 family)